MITKIPADKYCSVKEFAVICGLSRVAVYKALETGRLDGRRVGGIWIIPRNAVIRRNNVSSGRYIGVSALLRGDIDELKRKRNLR